MLWNRRNTKKKDVAFGFTEGRRREQAILIANTTKWRLRTLGISHTQSMHDGANAFPSMGHPTLKDMIDTTCKIEDGPFIEARHKHSIVCIPTPQGERIYLEPAQGGLQGDAAMASEFGQAYEESLDGWAKNHKRQILAEDPITKKKIHIGTTMYADDISDINIIADDGFAEIADERNKELDDILNNMHMAQNKDKEEHLLCMIGPGSVKESQRLIAYSKTRKETTKDFGEVKTEGKILGKHLSDKWKDEQTH
jgi:hypothetical protein